MQVGEKLVRVGASASNIMNGDAPPELVRQLLEARLGAELHHPSPHSISESEVDRDWNLLQRAMSERDSSLTSRSASLDANAIHGNRDSTGVSRTPLP